VREFIVELYANENFPIYLGAIILVLLIAFFIVFFLGKKDKKKIEMTQRLETIKADAFKEVTPPVKVEAVPAENSAVNIPPQIPQTPISEPSQGDLDSQVNTANVEVVPTEPMQIPIPQVNIQPVTYEPEVSPMPTAEVTINENPYNAQTVISNDNIQPDVAEIDLSNFRNLAASIETELSALEKQQELARPIVENIPQAEPVMNYSSGMENVNPTPVITTVMTSPVVDNQDIVKPILEPIETETIKIDVPEKREEIQPNPTKVMTGVFSSVYAPKKEEPSFFEDTMAIELPRLKDTQKNDDNRMS